MSTKGQEHIILDERFADIDPEFNQNKFWGESIQLLAKQEAQGFSNKGTNFKLSNYEKATNAKLNDANVFSEISNLKIKSKPKEHKLNKL